MKIRFPLFSSLVFYFKIFYGYTRYKIFVLFALVLLGGVSEGLGISILIPLLSYESGGTANNKYAEVVYRFLDSAGLGVSLSSILILLVVLFSLKGLFLIMQTVLSSHICTTLTQDLRSSFLKKYSQVRYSYFVEKTIGYFNNIISTEINTAISGLNNYIRVIVVIIYVGIYLFSAFLINWRLTLVVVVVSGGIFFLLRRLSHVLQRLSIMVTRTNAKVQSLAIQSLYNFKYLKSTNSFERILSQFDNAVRKNRVYQFRSAVYSSVPSNVMEPLTIIFLSCLIWYYVGLQKKQLGEILVLPIFFHRAIKNLLQLQGAWQRFSTYVGSILVLRDVEKDLNKYIEPRGLEVVEELKQSIELCDVNFAYNIKQVLFGVNLKIPKNRAVGIVGPSGAGKTTLFDILTGLIAPQSGSVTLDGINYSDVDMVTFRRKIGYVTQEPVIFNDTIANNINLWRCADHEDECMAKTKRAAELANCTQFIDEAENGIGTLIGGKGGATVWGTAAAPRYCERDI